ncbi:MAG: hypothetical protein WAR24_24110 [Candidatus Acidiferrales bacterium]
MPEIVLRLSEFNAHLALAVSFWTDVNHTAFPLFLCETVDEEEGLPGLDIR